MLLILFVCLFVCLFVVVVVVVVVVVNFSVSQQMPDTQTCISTSNKQGSYVSYVVPWHADSERLQTPTRSWVVVHLMFSLSVPSSNLSLVSQELAEVSENSTKSSAFVSLFFVSKRFFWHFVAVSSTGTLRQCIKTYVYTALVWLNNNFRNDMHGRLAAR